MFNVLIVALGGAIGSTLRYLVGMATMRVLGPGFPWSTLGVNIVGCFIMGVFIEVMGRRFNVSNELRLFIATGVLGGFTTFSAFSLDFAVLWERGEPLPAVLYALASVCGALIAVFAGLMLARSLA